MAVGKKLSRLRVQGHRLVDVEGTDVVLKGVNIADPEHIYRDRPRVSLQDVVDRVLCELGLGCRVVRIPVIPEDFYGYGYGLLHQKETYFFRYLKPIVDYCTEVGLYAILDMHYVDGEPYVDGKPSFGYLEKKQEACDFWTFIAPLFKDYANVIYEIYNEPVQPHATDPWKGPFDWSTWKNEMAQPLVNLIREHATENLILVGGPNYCQEISKAAIDPVKDPAHEPASIAYVMHYYPGHPPELTIEKVLDPIVDKVPVFVSEWGFEQGAGQTVHGTADVFGNEIIEYTQKHRLGWTAWIYDSVWPSRMVNAKWELLGKEGPDADSIEANGRMGGFVKRYLKD